MKTTTATKKQTATTTSANPSLTPFIKNMETLFNYLNKKLFNDKLPKPVITVQSGARESALGWCTNFRAWKSKEAQKFKITDADFINDGYFEINLSAEYTARDFIDIATTMLHEMIHLQNCILNIKDTSNRGRFHNKNFKTTAENHGLIVSQSEKYGWSETVLNDKARAIINAYKNSESFELYRYTPQNEKKARQRQYTRKYVCPHCKTTIRAGKAVNLICADCNERMIEDTKA